MSRVLVIDDEEIVRDATAEALRRAGHDVEAFGAGRPALERFAAASFHAVVTDLRMPDLDGMAVLEEVKRQMPETPVIVVTAHGTIQSAVEAMKKGAFDYVIKPLNLDELELPV